MWMKWLRISMRLKPSWLEWMARSLMLPTAWASWTTSLEPISCACCLDRSSRFRLMYVLSSLGLLLTRRIARMWWPSIASCSSSRMAISCQSLSTSPRAIRLSFPLCAMGMHSLLSLNFFFTVRCKNEVSSMTCNLILVEACRYEELAKLLLTTQNFIPFFSLIQDSNFDIASNSFTTFKVFSFVIAELEPSSLLGNPDQAQDSRGLFLGCQLRRNLWALQRATQFLELCDQADFAEGMWLHFCVCSCAFLAYVQLLGELLLDRTNFHVMTKYIAQASNLKLMMNLLRDPSKNIQFEAFHVFKVWCEWESSCVCFTLLMIRFSLPIQRNRNLYLISLWKTKLL